MNRTRGFTLVELLAVVAIMLVLMAATFGTFNIFAERAGPDAILSTIQSYVNGARDHASSSGVTTRVYFSADLNRPQDGTTLSIKFMPVGYNTSNQSDWDNFGQDVPGMTPLTLMEGTYILKDLGLTYPPIPTNATEWQTYDQRLYTALTTYATGNATGGQIKTDHQNFFIEIDPSGYLNPSATGSSSCKPVQNGLIVVKAAAGGVVTGYAFYPLNCTAGTRLVFE